MNRREFLSFFVAAPVTRSLPWAGIARALATIAPKTSQAITATLIVAVTLRRYQAELSANVLENNALLTRLKQKRVR